MIAVLGICIGASLGALLRWGLSLLLNSTLPHLLIGTLAANLLGGYLVGVAMGFFTHCTALAPEWRLFAITGFLGGLTTFSTFSAEVTTQLQTHHYGWAAMTIGGHVVGSIATTFLGLSTCSWLIAKLDHLA